MTSLSMDTSIPKKAKAQHMNKSGMSFGGTLHSPVLTIIRFKRSSNAHDQTFSNKMNPRGHESPMDFEWQTHAPADVTSPFHKLAMEHHHNEKKSTA
jgi:hypothetical protein